jgi:hypothetical protein
MTKPTVIFIIFILVMVIASVIAGIVFTPIVGMITACAIFITFGIGAIIFQK